MRLRVNFYYYSSTSVIQVFDEHKYLFKSCQGNKSGSDVTADSCEEPLSCLWSKYPNSRVLVKQNNFVNIYRYFKVCLSMIDPHQVFNGNLAGNLVKMNTLECPVSARCVRINPTTWTDWISMRFDVLGCNTTSSGIVGQNIRTQKYVQCLIGLICFIIIYNQICETT